MLKRAMNNSIRYAGKNTHLGAVYLFIRTHRFDYSFEKFWRRRPPDGVMLPLVRSEDKPDESIAGRQYKKTQSMQIDYIMTVLAARQFCDARKMPKPAAMKLIGIFYSP